MSARHLEYAFCVLFVFFADGMRVSTRPWKGLPPDESAAVLVVGGAVCMTSLAASEVLCRRVVFRVWRADAIF